MTQAISEDSPTNKDAACDLPLRTSCFPTWVRGTCGVRSLPYFCTAGEAEFARLLLLRLVFAEEAREIRQCGLRSNGSGREQVCAPTEAVLGSRTAISLIAGHLFGNGMGRKRNGFDFPFFQKIEAIQVHHLIPDSHEVMRECCLRVAAGVHLRNGAELSV